MNEISQVNEDLKASNQFKYELSYCKTLYNLFSLNRFANDRFRSRILTEEQPLELIKLCEFNLKEDKFKLLYRSSQDGFRPKDFHSRCDGKANTLTILKANGFIFGGFTKAIWDSGNQFKSDPNAFLFSLANKENKPCKMNIKEGHNVIYCHPSYGPTFGDGCDICIKSNSNTTNGSYSNLDHSYTHPQYAYGTNEAQSFLAGSYNFLLSEIEVYQKE